MTPERTSELWQVAMREQSNRLRECLDAIAAQRARIERLEAALKPFSDYWNTYGYGPEKGMDGPFKATAEAMEAQ